MGWLYWSNQMTRTFVLVLNITNNLLLAYYFTEKYHDNLILYNYIQSSMYTAFTLNFPAR
jgi:hypothetical protein